MPILDAHQRTVRDGIKPEEVNHLLDSARMIRQMRVGDGLLGYVGESGVAMAPHILPPHAGWEEPTTHLGFFAKIIDHGPDAQGDYGDERYWVQELFEASPNGSTIHDPLRLVNEALLTPAPGAVEKYPVRWVTATNLAEIPTSTHDAPTDGTTIVRVSMVRSPDDAAKFYFNRGVGTASTVARFVAVIGVAAGMVTTRDIQKHMVGGLWDGRWEFSGDMPVPMHPWPLVDVSEYLQFLVRLDAEGLIVDDGRILGASKRGGAWFVTKPSGIPVLVKPDNTAMFGDYFEAHILDAAGVRTPLKVKVAKPFDLRQTPFDGQIIRWSASYEVEYSYWSPPTMRTATRRAHGTNEDEDHLEIVWKPYHAVEYIGDAGNRLYWFTYPLWALEVGAHVTGVPGVPWLDLNIDARIWVER